jgi:hypothetical protein
MRALHGASGNAVYHGAFHDRARGRDGFLRGSARQQQENNRQNMAEYCGHRSKPRNEL